jgi:hypothetical protein
MVLFRCWHEAAEPEIRCPGATDTLAHGDPAFQHEGANLVDDAGALRHQPLAHPMRRLHIQLLRGLDLAGEQIDPGRQAERARDNVA